MHVTNVKAAAYQQFPYSLLILCTQYIETHLYLFMQKGIEYKLPPELSQAKRKRILT